MSNYKPKILINKNAITLYGYSIPEDAYKIYRHFIKKIRTYKRIKANSSEKTRLYIKFNVINSASLRHIVEFLKEAITIENIEVYWYYDKEDDVLLEDIQAIEEAIDFKIHKIPEDYS